MRYNLSMSKKKSYIIFSIIVVLGIVIDLVSKVLFANYFSTGSGDITVIPNFFYFTFVKNTGAAFGMFGESTLALTIVSVIFVVLFIIYDVFYHSNNLWYISGLSMLISGAIGNFIDRVALGWSYNFFFFSFCSRVNSYIFFLHFFYLLILFKSKE